MRMPMLVALLLAMTCACAVTAVQAQELKFDPARDAARDVALAVEKARAEGKHVLVDVGGEWCVWCHILDRFFAGDAEARALRDRNYVLVKVNWSPANHNDALLSRWPKIDGYPHLFVLDANGRLVRSQSTGPLELGRGYDRDKVIAFLRRYAPRHAATAAPSRTLIPGLSASAPA
jgi:thiol:disulfide interchange protein